MTNQVGILPLYLAWQNLVPPNSSQVTVVNVGQTASESTAKYVTELPAGYVVFPSEKVAYKLYRDRKTWDNARKYCIGEGANLAVIDSFQKVNYVMDLKGPNTEPDIQVGIHRQTDNNQYVEIKTGSTLEVIPWSNPSLKEDMSRKCVVIPFAGGGVVASHCNSAYNFVCEISIFRG